MFLHFVQMLPLLLVLVELRPPLVQVPLVPLVQVPLVLLPVHRHQLLPLFVDPMPQLCLVLVPLVLVPLVLVPLVLVQILLQNLD